jgi:hypothetical protein
MGHATIGDDDVGTIGFTTMGGIGGVFVAGTHDSPFVEL